MGIRHKRAKRTGDRSECLRVQNLGCNMLALGVVFPFYIPKCRCRSARTCNPIRDTHPRHPNFSSGNSWLSGVPLNVSSAGCGATTSVAPDMAAGAAGGGDDDLLCDCKQPIVIYIRPCSTTSNSGRQRGARYLPRLPFDPGRAWEGIAPGPPPLKRCAVSVFATSPRLTAVGAREARAT